MHHLKCNVDLCQYNSNLTCNKQEILVSQSNLDATKCQSYLGRNKNSYLSEMAKEFMVDKDETVIKCNVDKCVHNRHYDCYAKKIEIVKEANGNSRCETYEV